MIAFELSGEKKNVKNIISYEDAFKSSVKYFQGNDLSAKVFLDKYALRDSELNILEENADDMHWRLTDNIYRIEKYKYKNPIPRKTIYNYLKNFGKIIPQGSPMYGIGNPYQFVTLSSCYVVESPKDSYAGIMRTDEQLVQISKRRGGAGLDISALRPTGAHTSNAARTSTGIISFMQRFSNTIREVGQSGRRGALLISLSVHHPEVLRFISSKKDLTKITGANISVKLTDEFLKAVEEDTEYELRWPVDSSNPSIRKNIKAKEVWNAIIENAWTSAEPGLLFWDNIIRESPADCYSAFGFKTESTNPCITSDMWIMTDIGAKQVKELIDTPFTALINAKKFASTDQGFFQTGIKETYKVTTKSGFIVNCTKNHLMKHAIRTKRDYKYKWTALEKLNVGDLLVLDGISTNNNWGETGNFEEGWLVGSLLGDGVVAENSAKLCYWGNNKMKMKKLASNFIHNNFNARADLGSGSATAVYAIQRDTTSVKSKKLWDFASDFITKNKEVKTELEQTSSEFHKGFISGLFDADGTVLYSDVKTSRSIRLSSVSISNLETVQRMLLRLGIMSRIYKNRKDSGYRDLPDGKGGYKKYFCKANHELVISKNNIQKFSTIIGFKDEIKQEKLQKSLNSLTKRGLYCDYMVDPIESIKSIGEKEVYDCTIKHSHAFSANGIIVHNCSELPLSPLDSCRLLVLNAYSYVKKPFTNEAFFDFEEFYQDAIIAQRFMDDIIDLELECINRIINKIISDPEDEDIKRNELNLWKKIRTTCETGRRTGTGITGVADALAASNISYGSEEGIEAVGQIYKSLKLGAYRGSVELAKELGAFPVFDTELEKDNPFLNRIKEEDIDLWNDMQKYGRRNIACLTTAPAGSVSLLTQTTSGIEPLFKMSYSRRKKINPNDKEARVDFVDQLGDAWQEFDVYHPKLADWMAVTGETDIQKSPWANNCAEDINWEHRVRLQAIATQHIDHSISSTINLPESASKELVSQIYTKAWKSGCKGMTVYRANSRTGVMIDTKDKAKKEKPEEDCIDCKRPTRASSETGSIKKTHAIKRPKELPSHIYHVKVKGEAYFVVVGLLANEPYEVFAGKNGHIQKGKYGITAKIKRGKYLLFSKNGESIESLAEHSTEEEEALTRMISISLRHGADISFVVHQLEKIDGDLQSLSKAIARTLKRYIVDGTKVSGETCMECKMNSLVREQGCVICQNCGWTKCS